MSKICRQCLAEKPLVEFYRHRQMADGFLNECKSCVKTRVKTHRDQNIDKIRAYDRSRGSLAHRVSARKKYAKTEQGREALRRGNLKYFARYPEKRRANNIVNNAIRNGTLIRQSCVRCGSDSAEAHHEDYAKPLDVIWFCDLHHKERHKELRNNAREH
jgi:hypothetical protein